MRCRLVQHTFVGSPATADAPARTAWALAREFERQCADKGVPSSGPFRAYDGVVLVVTAEEP